MHLLEHRRGSKIRRAPERGDRFRGCASRVYPVPETVGDDQSQGCPHAPAKAHASPERVSPAIGFTIPPTGVDARASGADLRDHYGTLVALRVNVEFLRKAGDGAESGAGGRSARIAVRQALRKVGHSRAAIDRENFDAARDSDPTAASGTLLLRGHVSGGSCRSPWRPARDFRRAIRRGLRRAPGRARRGALRRPGLRRPPESPLSPSPYPFHRVTTTRVPTPTLDSMENSLQSRLEPPSPKPSPLPDV